MRKKSEKNRSPSMTKGELRATEILKEEGLKLTLPRRSLISVLTKEHGPFTMEELHVKAIKNSMENIDIVTIYRAMATFEEIGLVNKCDFNDGCIRYELAHENHHHHIVCRSCKKSETVEVCPVEDFREIPKRFGFKKITHRLEFFGICPKCDSQKTPA